MSEKTAKYLSYLFSPLIMPLCLGSIILFVDPVYSTLVHIQIKWAILLVLFLNTAVLPLSLLYVLKRRGLISSYNVPDSKERLVPFMVSILLYAVSISFFRNPLVPTVLESMLLSVLCGLILAMCLNFFWKISLHLMGVGGLLGGLVAIFYQNDYFLPGIFSAVILLAGLIGTARLRLQIHTLSQLYAGFVLGGFLSLYFILQEIRLPF